MNLFAKISLLSITSILIVFIAYSINLKYKPPIIERTLAGLLRAEEDYNISSIRRVAIGFGSCHDLIVRSSDVFLEEDSPQYPQHFDIITTKEALLKVFAYFFEYGAAAERYVSNTTLFNELVILATQTKHSQWKVGGNAAVMANLFAQHNWEVFLGSQISQRLQNKLPSSIRFSGPQVERDDIHLLLEYSKGEQWGKFTSPRANRFIIHSDHQNPLLTSLESFQQQLNGFNPHLLVIGGLQMLDNFPLPPAVRKDRLDKVRNIVESHASSSQIHFEMASFTDRQLLNILVTEILPHVDSLGMNEQELPNLVQLLQYGNISVVAESIPRIAAVLDEMRLVFRLLEKARPLTRLHVHTLAFQVIMTSKGSNWRNIRASAAKAALTAYRHTCGSYEVNTAHAMLIVDDSFTTSLNIATAQRIQFRPDEPVACWSEAGLDVCLAPVLVCTKVVQTGGGGDNVSSAGLVLQV